MIFPAFILKAYSRNSSLKILFRNMLVTIWSEFEISITEVGSNKLHLLRYINLNTFWGKKYF